MGATDATRNVGHHPLRPAREVVLSKSRWIIVGWEPQQGYMVAYYRPAKPWAPDSKRQKVSRLRLERIVPDGVTLEKGDYVRFAASHPSSFSRALLIALADSEEGGGESHETVTLLEAYIRATPWGEDIPQDDLDD